MSDIYNKQNMNSKQAQQDVRRELQKRQLQILDEDGKLRRLEKLFEEKRKQLEQTKHDIEKMDVELMNLNRKKDLLQKDLTTAERDVSLQKGRIRKLEYDTEQYREKTYRRDKIE
jgi:hypothetical protein